MRGRQAHTRSAYRRLLATAVFLRILLLSVFLLLAGFFMILGELAAGFFWTGALDCEAAAGLFKTASATGPVCRIPRNSALIRAFVSCL